MRRPRIPLPSPLLLPFLALLALLAGCDAAAEPAAEATARDSAGITIVENRVAEGVPPAPIRLSAEPVLRIGALDGHPSIQFHRVQHAARLSDGGIVVADGGSGEIRFFGPDGAFLHAAGGLGEGPGEFQLLSYMRTIRGDSVLVFDGRARRVSVIAPDGSHARDHQPRGEGDGPPAIVVAGLDDGTLLARAGMSVGSATGSGLRRDTVAYAVITPAGREVPLDPVPGAEALVDIQSSGGSIVSISVMRIPYARGAAVAAGSSRFLLGTTERYEFRRHERDGRLSAIIRSDHVPVRPVTPQLVRGWAERQVEQRARLTGGATPAEDAELRRMFEELPRVESLPAWASAVVDASGRLWVEEYALPGEEGREEPGRWTLFDADGRLVGSVETPPGFQVRFIDDETVVGVAPDDFDVEYVHVYRLESR